jgi:hypothetical protein
MSSQAKIILLVVLSAYGLTGCGTIFVAEKHPVVIVNDTNNTAIEPNPTDLDVINRGEMPAVAVLTPCNPELDFAAELKPLNKTLTSVQFSLYGEAAEVDIVAQTEQLAILQTEYMNLAHQGSCAANMKLADIYLSIWDSQTEQALLISDHDPAKLDLEKALQHSQLVSEHGQYEATLIMAQVYALQASLADSNADRLAIDKQAYAAAELTLQQLDKTALPPHMNRDDEVNHIKKFMTVLSEHITKLESWL